ncbi:MAG: hypothetical protein WDM81_11240 [Rhizomicrobium sp.]
MSGAIPAALGKALGELKAKLAAEKPNAGTRRTSEKVLEVVNGTLTTTVGGSADLTPSNNTKTKNITEIKPDHFDGRYVHYGIREHGMAGGDERHGAAWRDHPLWRHLPRLLRLLPPVDPARGADGHPRDLRDDARFHRRGRGRPDAPAGGASGGAARDPESDRHPPRRRGGDGRGLGHCAQSYDRPELAGLFASGRADAAVARDLGPEPDREGRLRDRRRRGREGDPAGDGIGSEPGDAGAGLVGQGWDRGPRRVAAELEPVRAAVRSGAGRRARQAHGPDRGRGRGCARAGTAISGRMAALSECMVSARAGPIKTCTSISA